MAGVKKTDFPAEYARIGSDIREAGSGIPQEDPAVEGPGVVVEVEVVACY